MEAWIFWAVFAVIAFVTEAVTVGLVSVWFGLAALVTALFAAAFVDIITAKALFILCQIVIFAGFSVLFLYLTKPLAAKFFNPKETNSPAGKSAIVIEDINNLEGKGQIKIGGVVWSAKSENNEIIRKGEKVTVKEIAGVSAIVAVTDSVMV